MNTRFDTEARIAVTQAADIARELGHREVGPHHLLLGLLANPRGAAYAALTEHGLRLDAARDLVARSHADGRRSCRRARPGGPTSPQTSAYDDDREALRAIGIDLDRVRDAVRDNLGQDLGDGWGDRPERSVRGRESAAGSRRPAPPRARRGSPAAVALAAGGPSARSSRGRCAPCCATYDARSCATASATTTPQPSATDRRPPAPRDGDDRRPAARRPPAQRRRRRPGGPRDDPGPRRPAGAGRGGHPAGSCRWLRRSLRPSRNR